VQWTVLRVQLSKDFLAGGGSCKRPVAVVQLCCGVIVGFGHSVCIQAGHGVAGAMVLMRAWQVRLRAV
jgi:hypothetical protein